MKFGPVATEAAVGAILAHTLALPGDGSIKKGHTLSAADVARIAASSIATVTVARLDADDVHEDAAAKRIATQLGGPGVRVAAPFTGRANLYAATAGILKFDAARMAALNLNDERITVATLRDGERVEAGQMLATIKIIPFAVDAEAVSRAETGALAARCAVAEFKPRAAGLVLTTLRATKPAVIDKRTRAVAERLAALGSTLAATRIVAHDPAAIATALTELAQAGREPLLVFSASAIVDRADVVPAGLVASGGTITRFGMPVDPGNLLLLGRLGATPVIGVPSCAASPKLNGFDWVLERVVAGIEVTSQDVAAMAVGGLLKEIPSRPQPRDNERSALGDGARTAPRITAVVLAAGRSTRMGRNKLLEHVDGKPIVRHVVEAIQASAVGAVRVVVGNEPAAVKSALAGLDVSFVDNPDFASGIASSVKAGIRGLPPATGGALIALGDMPDLSSDDFNRLIAAFSPDDGRSIVVPVVDGKRGNPVLWGAEHFRDLQELSGDSGAKHLLGLNGDCIAEVALAGDAALTDIDTPEALAALRRRRELRAKDKTC